MTTTKKLLPQRHPNRDFFIADILDAMPKGDMGTMEHPFFSLSKKPDTTVRQYEHNGNILEIIPSVKGLATIWDKDILIFCVSQLVAGINRDRDDISQTVRVTAYELLKSTNRSVGGKDYRRLVDALNRLRGTTITTSIRTGGKLVKSGFGLIETYKLLSDDHDRMMSIDIKLSDWLYRAATNMEVLTVNPDYFRLRGGLERRVYEIARKHCGGQAKWTIGVELLYKKSGARSPIKQFRHELKNIAAAGIMPDYRIVFDAEKDQAAFYNRKSPKAAQAEALDQLARLGYSTR